MSKARHSLLKRFRRSRSGTAAIEFAILVVPLVGLILASLQTALVFVLDEAIQSATTKAARQVMTGAAQTSGTTQAQFLNTVCGNLPSFFNCPSLMVDVESASSYAALNTSAPTLTYSGGSVSNAWQFSTGSAGDIVIVRVMYLWPIVGGSLMPGLANQTGGNRLLIGTAVVKNEPYG